MDNGFDDPPPQTTMHNFGPCSLADSMHTPAAPGAGEIEETEPALIMNPRVFYTVLTGFIALSVMLVVI